MPSNHFITNHCVIEPDNRIGGLNTGGLGAIDIGSKSTTGGISLEFYKKNQKTL